MTKNTDTALVSIAVERITHSILLLGAIQATNVLNSPRAVMMGIHVVRVFVQLRDLLVSNNPKR